MLMKTEDIEKIYAGWLGKMIGIRMGAPIEGFSYEQIKNIYGEPDGSPGPPGPVKCIVNPSFLLQAKPNILNKILVLAF